MAFVVQGRGLNVGARGGQRDRPATCSSARRGRSVVRSAALFPWQKAGENASAIPLTLDPGYAFLAHPEKVSGEDAFFIEGNALGVFDGVTTSADRPDGSKIDPRLFSQQLAQFTLEAVKDDGPENVVRSLISATIRNEAIGAATACVVGLDKKQRLFGINLGDSGVRIVRNGKVDWRTKEQMHMFNCPYQLGTDSPDNIQMGQNILRTVKKDDWLIVATDGLFDNVYDASMVEVIAQYGAQGASAVAEQLGDLAVSNSQDQTFRSPFSLQAERYKKSAPGGKLDDVTVIAAKVVEDANWEPISCFSTL